MRRWFYTKLAFTGIQKNGKVYYPYILTCIGTILMYYMIHAMAGNEGLQNLKGAESVRSMMYTGAWVIAIFAVIFLLYTNSFVMKRRTTELGLYHILGLEKHHVSRLLLTESIQIWAVSMAGGLLGGILLYKLMVLVLLRVMGSAVRFDASVNPISLVQTVLLFTGIMVLCLIVNLVRILRLQPIELLRGGQEGEKEPKAKWFSALLGLVMLGVGYYIAITVESPLQAFYLLFIAVILVIGGTYSLFMSGSIVILKLMKGNPKFYYKINHFTTVSGMLYRMKQNAAGLSSICILCTIVLVIISSTTALYVGRMDLLDVRCPTDFNITAYTSTMEEENMIREIAQEKADSEGIFITFLEENSGTAVAAKPMDADGVFRFVEDQVGVATDMVFFSLVPADYYHDTDGNMVELEEDEVVFCYLDGQEFSEDTLKLENDEFKVVDIISYEDEVVEYYGYTAYQIYMKDRETLESFYERYTGEAFAHYIYDLEFDLELEAGEQEIFSSELRAACKERLDGLDYLRIMSREDEKKTDQMLMGGFLFLGVYLGIVFLMATALIIYYKQISEGYEDKKRFEIMQKVGMGKAEVKSSIGSQILMVFTLPILTAVIHLAGAFRMIEKCLNLFALYNVKLFLVCNVCTIVVFAVVYGGIYYLTARAYYNIVNTYE